MYACLVILDQNNKIFCTTFLCIVIYIIFRYRPNLFKPNKTAYNISFVKFHAADLFLMKIKCFSSALLQKVFTIFPWILFESIIINENNRIFLEIFI